MIWGKFCLVRERFFVFKVEEKIFEKRRVRRFGGFFEKEVFFFLIVEVFMCGGGSRGSDKSCS